MARTKKVSVKKTKQKQSANVHVVVNSNNRKKTVASSKAAAPQPVYIPSGSQASAPIVLTQNPQPHPSTRADVAAHIETLVKKYSPPEKTIMSKAEPEKKVIEDVSVKRDVLGEHVKVEPEIHLSPVSTRRTRTLIEPHDVPGSVSTMSDAAEPPSRGKLLLNELAKRAGSHAPEHERAGSAAPAPTPRPSPRPSPTPSTPIRILHVQYPIPVIRAFAESRGIDIPVHGVGPTRKWIQQNYPKEFKKYWEANKKT